MHKIDLSKETSVIAYLDMTNMFHWQRTLKWNFAVYAVIQQLFQSKAVREIRIYYGINEREKEKSENFHRRLRECGAIVITKPVKWIRKDLEKELFVRPHTLGLFNGDAHDKLEELIQCLKGQGINYLVEPKCNFDVEISLDMLDATDKVSGLFLFSGDSDFREPLQRLKLKGKNLYVFGVRGQMASELIQLATFIDFGKWYQGPKKRKPHP